MSYSEQHSTLGVDPLVLPLHDDEAEDGKTCPNCGVVFDEENDEESDYV